MIHSISKYCARYSSAVFCTDIPHGPIDAQLDDPNEDEDLISPDTRRPRRLLDSRRQADGELSDSDDEGEDDRRNHASHRDKDSIGPTGRRFGAAVGIMSTGTTHGIGPTVSLPVLPTTVGSSANSEMEIDDDDVPLAVRSNKAKASDAMEVDPPGPSS